MVLTLTQIGYILGGIIIVLLAASKYGLISFGKQKPIELLMEKNCDKCDEHLAMKEAVDTIKEDIRDLRDSVNEIQRDIKEILLLKQRATRHT